MVLPVFFQGGRAVLCLYGYSNQQPDGLSFPDDVADPDVGKVAAITLEVMSLRMELEMLIKVRLLFDYYFFSFQYFHWPHVHISDVFYNMSICSKELQVCDTMVAWNSMESHYPSIHPFSNSLFFPLFFF